MKVFDCFPSSPELEKIGRSVRNGEGRSKHALTYNFQLLNGIKQAVGDQARESIRFHMHHECKWFVPETVSKAF